MLFVNGRYVELEELLSLKDKEILEKTHRLEDLTTQASNQRTNNMMICCCAVIIDQKYSVYCENFIDTWKLSSQRAHSEGHCHI